MSKSKALIKNAKAQATKHAVVLAMFCCAVAALRFTVSLSLMRLHAVTVGVDPLMAKLISNRVETALQKTQVPA